MRIWGRIKNFFFAYKSKVKSSEHKGNIISEELQVQASLEKIKELGHIKNSEAEKLSTNSIPHIPHQKIKKINEKNFENEKKVSKTEVISESSLATEVFITEKQPRVEKKENFEILKETSSNNTKGNMSEKISKNPSISIPHHNTEEVKKDFQYYLVNGSEYEQVRAIQSIKKIVREKESSYGEYLEILLSIYKSSNKKIQTYILDALKFFPLNIEETQRVNELKPLEKNVEDVIKTDFKLENPRIVGSGIVKVNVEESAESNVNEKEKISSFKESKRISIDDSIKKEESEKLYQKYLSQLANLHEEINQRKQTDKEYIKEECLKRNITSIYHFTNARNVKKILQYGILSLDELVKKNIDFESNDSERRDRMKNSTCWSISFPNNKYFFRVRERNLEMKWCVIEVDASALFELDCYFYETNAASNKVKSQSASSRKGYDSFVKMFVRSSYKDGIFLSKYPTDVQAEVLITEVIKPNRIKAIHTQDVKVFDYYHKQYPHLVKNTPSLFRMRQ